MSGEVKRIHLSPPHLGEFERHFVEEAFLTNWIAPLGPNVEQFEREVAEYVGVSGGLALSSGTAAIHLALRLLNISQGDIVFCSSLTFVASVNPALYEGAVPVLIDSEPDSWNMSPQALERAMQVHDKKGELPKAVIVVNLYGQSANYIEIQRICERYGVPIVEDAAESLGATYQGRNSGTFGKFAIFSFNGNKIITTSGGGMLVSDDVTALNRARHWATQSRDPVRHYQHSELGYNYRMSNVLAGIGRGQLRYLEERVASRRRVFQNYLEALSSYPGIRFMPEIQGGKSTRWLTTLTVNSGLAGVSRDDIIYKLEENNIEARPVWKPMHLQPLLSKCCYYPHEENRSVSEELYREGLCLPSGSSLPEQEQDTVIGIILDLLS